MKTKNTVDWSRSVEMGGARLSRAAFGGLALSLMMLLGSSVTVGATFSLVHSFDETENFSPNNDGMFINGLVQAKDGNLYGTTAIGGPGSVYNDGSSYGTIFRVAPDGTFRTLYAFSGPDGWRPEHDDDMLSAGALVQATDGNFYETTYFGGPAFNAGGGNGCNGTVFKITPDGTLTTLVAFDGTNGRYPI